MILKQTFHSLYAFTGSTICIAFFHTLLKPLTFSCFQGHRDKNTEGTHSLPVSRMSINPLPWSWHFPRRSTWGKSNKEETVSLSPGQPCDFFWTVADLTSTGLVSQCCLCHFGLSAVTPLVQHERSFFFNRSLTQIKIHLQTRHQIGLLVKMNLEPTSKGRLEQELSDSKRKEIAWSRRAAEREKSVCLTASIRISVRRVEQCPTRSTHPWKAQISCASCILSFRLCNRTKMLLVQTLVHSPYPAYTHTTVLKGNIYSDMFKCSSLITTCLFSKHCSYETLP